MDAKHLALVLVSICIGSSLYLGGWCL